MTLSYAVVTPLHDEAATLPRLVASMTAQTVLPSTWVLVENDSADDTLEVATRLAASHPWIRVVTAAPPRAGERGALIVHAIHRGLEELAPLPEAVAQLDADLTFPADYFERILRELESNERLGIVSGTCYELSKGRWRERFATGANVWGAARAYRRACLVEVTPLEPRTGWDAIDLAEANALGWETRIVGDVPFYHHRREASRERTRWSAWTDQGRVSYYLGYRPSYLTLRMLFRAPRDPAAAGLIVGYLGQALRRRKRCAKPGVRAWVREQQRLGNLRRRANEAVRGSRRAAPE